LAVEQGQKPLSLLVTAGQRHDSPQFQPVLEAIRVPRLGLGRPRTRPDKVRADKTPHAVMRPSSCRGRGCWCVEGDRCVEFLVVGQAVVELAEHAAVEQVAKGCVVAVTGALPA